MDQSDWNSAIKGAFDLIISSRWLLVLIALLSSSPLLFYAASATQAAPGTMIKIDVTGIQYLSLFLGICGIAARPVMYGALIEHLRGKDYTVISVLKKYFINYLLTVLLLALPIVFIDLLVILVKGSYLAYSTVLTNLIFQIVSIYIFPFVFLSGAIFSSIIAGIYFLKQNVKKSLDLLFLAAIVGALAFAEGLFYRIFQEVSFLPSLLSFMTDFTAMFLGLLIFAAASLRIKSAASSV